MGKVKRLRIFAGPNGSGKSTIFSMVDEIVQCPRFVNADLIEMALRTEGKLSFNDFSITVNEDTFVDCFLGNLVYGKFATPEVVIENIKVNDNNLIVEPKFVDPYFAAFVADFLRFSMLNVVDKFTLETVMSDPRKLNYIWGVKRMGYHVYLYYITTKDVRININRVKQRISEGGHGVPEDKIIKRYNLSLENIYPAMKLSDRAYFFDNSGSKYEYLAEYDNGKLHLKVDTVPGWFDDFVLKKMQ